MAVVPRHFSGSTQLVGKALEDVQAGRTLFALPVEAGVPALFGQAFAGSTFLYDDYAIYRQDRDVARSDAELVFGLAPGAEDGPFDLAILYLPKGKERVATALSAVSPFLGPDATLLVVGPNRGGIRSSGKLIEAHVGPVEGSRSGRHCVLLTARKAVSAEAFQGKREYSVDALGHSVRVVSAPGVFSHGQLDAGTALLLEQLEGITFKRALDWGCGAGVVGTALKLAVPKGAVDFVDSGAPALEAARLTLRANGLADESVWASDGFSDVPGAYDLIVSNPPFHTGLKTDFAVTERFIEEAPQHLTRGGRLIVVANTFIKYTPIFRRSFSSMQVVAENSRYRVIVAERTGRATGVTRSPGRSPGPRQRS